MLKDSEVIAMVAVKSKATAKEFYGEKLGLTQVDENEGGVAFKCGDGTLFVYQSDTAGSGKATCANWNVDDIQAVVTDLQEIGIAFEHYDMPYATTEGAIHTMGPFKNAWFKDPDGNILGITQVSAETHSMNKA